MKAKEIIGEGWVGNVVKGGAALTGLNLLTDPSSDKFSSQGVGRAIRKTGGQVKDFVGGVYRGITGGNGKSSEEEPSSSTPSKLPAEREFSHGDNQPVQAPEPDSESEGYVQGVERRSQQNYKKWPGQQNESIKKKFAIAEKSKEKEDPLTALQRGIYGQESGSGKVKTDKPNYAGARGPMQIMPGTFDWMKKLKLIPQDYDIKNPKHNKEAGDALIAHYYKKYQGDPAKVAAAYYAGPGAINKDGTINTHWRDKKNPKAPTVGQYINQTLAKANLPVIAGATALASAPDSADTKAVVTKGGAAKPSSVDIFDIDKPMSGPGGEKLIQMPDFSQGFKVGDKFVPQTKKGFGEPIDYKQAYQKAKSEMGLSPEEAQRQANDELLAQRAAVRRTPARSMIEPIRKEPVKEPVREPVKEPEVTPNVIPPLSSNDRHDDTGAWDKFINTVTKGRVPPEEKETIRVPESINKEIADILRLAGKKK